MLRLRAACCKCEYVCMVEVEGDAALRISANIARLHMGDISSWIQASRATPIPIAP